MLMHFSTAQLSEEEKKAKKKAKKAASKAQEDPKKGMHLCAYSLTGRSHDTPAAAGSANEDKGLDASPPKDDDPDGKKLVQASDRLERAAKFLNPLTTHAAHNVDAWLAIYDVAIRRSTPLSSRDCSTVLTITQRSICKQYKHSTVPRHWTQTILASTYGWYT